MLYFLIYVCLIGIVIVYNYFNALIIDENDERF